MTVSLKNCALLVKLFYNNNDWALVDLQVFRTAKSIIKSVGPMSVQSVLQMVQKFEKTGSVDKCSLIEGEKELIRR